MIENERAAALRNVLLKVEAHLTEYVLALGEFTTGGRSATLLCEVRAALTPLAPLEPPIPCATCGGSGLIGGHSGQTPEQYQEHTESCPDCHPAGLAPAPSSAGLASDAQDARRESNDAYLAGLASEPSSTGGPSNTGADAPPSAYTVRWIGSEDLK